MEKSKWNRLKKTAFITSINLLIVLITCCLLLTIYKGSPIYFHRPELWDLLIPFLIMLLISGSFSLIYLFRLKKIAGQEFALIISQLLLTFILYYELSHDLRNLNTEMNICLACLAMLGVFFVGTLIYCFTKRKSY